MRLISSLIRAITASEVRRDGTGRRNDPFRCWLPEEERWKEDPWFEIREQLEADARKFREEHPELLPPGE